MDITIKELKQMSLSKLESLLEEGQMTGFEYPITEEAIMKAINQKMIEK